MKTLEQAIKEISDQLKGAIDERKECREFGDREGANRCSGEISGLRFAIDLLLEVTP